MGSQTLPTIVASVVVIATLILMSSGAVVADSGFDQPIQDDPYDCDDPEPGYEGYTCTDSGSIDVQETTENTPSMTAPDDDENDLDECEAAGERMVKWHNSRRGIGVATHFAATAQYGHCVSENTG